MLSIWNDALSILVPCIVPDWHWRYTNHRFLFAENLLGPGRSGQTFLQESPRSPFQSSTPLILATWTPTLLPSQPFTVPQWISVVCDRPSPLPLAPEVPPHLRECLS